MSGQLPAGGVARFELAVSDPNLAICIDVKCIAGDVDPERMSAIVFEELPSAHTTAPTADLPDDGELPFEQYKRTEMPVSAPQFFIGAKLDGISKKSIRLSGEKLRTL